LCLITQVLNFRDGVEVHSSSSCTQRTSSVSACTLCVHFICACYENFSANTQILLHDWYVLTFVEKSTDFFNDYHTQFKGTQVY
jgi:hypothetical protein